jgi:hypothetical protein
MAEQATVPAQRHTGRGAREFLVALPQLHLVQQILAGPEREDADGSPAIAVEDTESSEALGLAKIKLVDLDAAARVIKERVDADADATRWRKGVGRAWPKQAQAMDVFLLGLRAIIAGRSSGWTPTLGKNRLMGSVIGGGTISHGGGGAPQMIETELPIRGTDPGGGVRVGILDTAFSPQPWLAGGWSARYSDLLQGRGPYTLVSGHATFVAGLVLGQAPGATVQVRGVLDSEGKADGWTVAKEIVALGRAGVDILNLSLVCYTEDGEAPLAMATAIDRLDPNIVVVAAAGNHGRDKPASGPGRPKGGVLLDPGRRPAFPAALDDVVAVGSANDKQNRSDFTPKEVPWIDVLTWGENLVSTFLDGDVEIRPDDVGADAIGTPHGTTRFSGVAKWSGTSFAAALVSGAIAAGTQPGRVSARQAWEDISGSLQRGTPDAPLADGEPPFLYLNLIP